MRGLAKSYFDTLGSLMGNISVTDEAGAELGLAPGIEFAALLCLETSRMGNKIMFVGNGASASISSHLSTDFWKNGGMRAIAFNDCSGLTCISNDLGYSHVFEKPVEMFSDPGDLLVAISSSGNSENILRAASAAVNRGAAVITLSGFKPDNPLRRMGRLNFHVPALAYGLVEVLHHAVGHCILDVAMSKDRSE